MSHPVSISAEAANERAAAEGDIGMGDVAGVVGVPDERRADTTHHTPKSAKMATASKTCVTVANGRKESDETQLAEVVTGALNEALRLYRR